MNFYCNFELNNLLTIKFPLFRHKPWDGQTSHLQVSPCQICSTIDQHDQFLNRTTWSKNNKKWDFGDEDYSRKGEILVFKINLKIYNLKSSIMLFT